MRWGMEPPWPSTTGAWSAKASTFRRRRGRAEQRRLGWGNRRWEPAQTGTGSQGARTRRGGCACTPQPMQTISPVSPHLTPLAERPVAHRILPARPNLKLTLAALTRPRRPRPSSAAQMRRARDGGFERAVPMQLRRLRPHFHEVSSGQGRRGSTRERGSEEARERETRDGRDETRTRCMCVCVCVCARGGGWGWGGQSKRHSTRERARERARRARDVMASSQPRPPPCPALPSQSGLPSGRSLEHPRPRRSRGRRLGAHRRT